MVGKRGRRSIRHDAYEVDERQPRVPRSPQPPQILLRMLRYDDALLRLEQQLRTYQRHGTVEVLVVHGKGLRSPAGRGVLGQAVRDWCDRHGDVVRSWRVAPAEWGGEGAIVVTLKVG